MYNTFFAISWNGVTGQTSVLKGMSYDFEDFF